MLINDAKARTLQCLKILWNYIIKKKPKDIYSTTNFYVIAAQNFMHSIENTLILLT